MTIDEIKKMIKAGNVEEANAAMDQLEEENKQLFKGGFKYCFLLLLRIFKAFHAPLETALLHKLFWLVLPKKWSDTLYYKLIDLLTQENIYNYLCP